MLWVHHHGNINRPVRTDRHAIACQIFARVVFGHRHIAKPSERGRAVRVNLKNFNGFTADFFAHAIVIDGIQAVFFAHFF